MELVIFQMELDDYLCPGGVGDIPNGVDDEPFVEMELSYSKWTCSAAPCCTILLERVCNI
eukprot:293733-Amorphochlora_amoeboformis.AAC.1